MKRFFLFLLLTAPSLVAAPLPVITEIDWQPFAAQARRVVETLESLGSPLTAAELSALEEARAAKSPEKVQAVLDAHCLFGVQINPEMRVKVAAGPAKPELDEQGWRTFLVKVQNESGTTAELRAFSPNAEKMAGSPAGQVTDRWLELAMHNRQPLQPELGGLKLEYRVLQLYSRDAGKREAKFTFNVGQGTQDLGFRSETDILFTALPAREVTLRVRDDQGQPTTAAFVITDGRGRVYPAMGKRLAPDFAFHPQIYRADGEKIRLPDGSYQVEFSRGPESIRETRPMEVAKGKTTFTFQVKRWVDPALSGWFSGDHHIHAAGCAHYTKPTEGVLAGDMIRHVIGEDLKVGCNLTWGPCFDYQKQFFTGKDDVVSKYPYLLRYDIEVSGFGSHNSGHLCLLRLKDQMYPGGDSDKHWPTLCLNTLRWAKKQGAVTGPAHSGWGLEVKTADLPNYIIPPYSGIGANEYIVDVTHDVPGPDGAPVPAVDFLSTVDTPYVWELNMWYQTLNAGFRTRISGETDFPCIYGERVGLGRSYVKQDGRLDYDRWCEGIRQGRNYVSDGRSHLLDFQVNDRRMGEEKSELKLAAPGKVRVQARVAAWLYPDPESGIRERPYTSKPYWHIERARVGDSREVPVEVIVNGYPVARKMVVADGRMDPVSFDVPLERSSWVALRILPSSHTNPVFVEVGSKPIRSRRSVDWCLKGVEQCWSQKQRFIREEEKDDAQKAYQHARAVYTQRLAECEAD